LICGRVSPHEIRRRSPLAGAGRQRWPRLPQLSPGEIHALRRARRGDGGHGGSVFLRATLGINTLADFRVERTFKAQSGDSGSGNDCTGRGGDDLYVPVPVGTIVRDSETHEQLGDLIRDGDVLQVAQGGKGGWGNAKFKTSTNRACSSLN
jgi:Obg family GTPase CgtA